MREPAVVAINTKTGRVLAIGEEASLMLGRTPDIVQAIRPLRDGVISDFRITELMLKEFIGRVNTGFLARYFKPTIVVCVPSVITPVEQKAVEDACRHAGAKEVYLIREPVAAAIGAGIDSAGQAVWSLISVAEPQHCSYFMCRPVVDESIKIAGDKLMKRSSYIRQT